MKSITPRAGDDISEIGETQKCISRTAQSPGSSVDWMRIDQQRRFTAASVTTPTPMRLAHAADRIETNDLKALHRSPAERVRSYCRNQCAELCEVSPMKSNRITSSEEMDPASERGRLSGPRLQPEPGLLCHGSTPIC